AIELELELSDSLELNIQIAAHLVETRTVFLEDLAARVQEVDDAVELISRHVEAARLRNPRNSAMWTPLGCHRKGDGPARHRTAEVFFLQAGLIRIARPSTAQPRAAASYNPAAAHES